MSKALDGKTYWNGWTNNYRPGPDIGGYIEHAICEEDRTGKSLCGVRIQDSGLMSIPGEMNQPGCRRCAAIMRKRGAIKPD